MDASRFSLFGMVTTVFAGNLADPDRGAINSARLALAIEGAAVARRVGIPYVIVLGDQGAQGELLTALFEGLGVIVLQQDEAPRGRGMLVSRQQALRAGADYISVGKWIACLWTEPEKVAELLHERNLATLISGFEAVAEGKCDGVTICCPEMNNYPALQQETERRASARIAERVGKDYDSHRGPNGGNLGYIEVMLDQDESYGIMHTVTCVLPQTKAVQHNLVVGCLYLIGFHYPELQRMMEDGHGNIEQIRATQEKLADLVILYVDDHSVDGVWSPAGRFIDLN